MALGATAARGGGAILLGQIVRIAIQFVGLILLTRLLTPADFGLITMVVAIVGVGELFRDFGLSSAAMQADEVSHGESSNLFWVNTALGLLLSGLVMSLAVPIASFYRDPRLVAVTLVISSTFLLNGIQTQFRVVLARNMNFVSLTITEVVAQLASLMIAVLLALFGSGYWALIWQQVTSALFLCLLRLMYSRWRPSLPSRSISVRRFVKYGWSLALAQLVGYGASNVDSVVIGARQGSTVLGYYSRAYQILMIPVSQLLSPLTNVVLPVLSSIQSDITRYRRYVRTLHTVAGFGAGALFSLVVVAAEPGIKFLLGPTWSQSAVVLQILAIGGFFQVLTFVGYWVFLSRAITGSLLRYNLVSKSLVVASVLVGSQWGVLGVAWGYSIGLTLSWPILLFWLRREKGFPARILLIMGVKLCATCWAASGLGLFASRLASNGVVSLFIGGGVVTAMFMVFLVVSPVDGRELQRVMQLVRGREFVKS